MTSCDQMSEAEVMCSPFALSDSEGLSRVGPNTVARLWRDILLMGSFSATLQNKQQQGGPMTTRQRQTDAARFRMSNVTMFANWSWRQTEMKSLKTLLVYRLRCSNRVRKVMRLGSGRERRRCIMQFSLAAGSERAAKEKKNPIMARGFFSFSHHPLNSCKTLKRSTDGKHTLPGLRLMYEGLKVTPMPSMKAG